MSWLQDAEVTLPKTPEELLAEAQAAKIKEINAAYSEQAAPLIKDYPEIEQATWLAQEAQAHAYPQGDPPETPVLANILLGRNGDDGTETLEHLAHAVLSNAAMFTEFQQLTGRRQRLVRMVREAETVEEVNAIEW